ncbi:SAV_2336 N-terminal domain-related protein [Streptomyces poriticola]|uniref:SAV_2336 N-terminal domain-related protein n=1 Tax=Streptomyces poriticola TaxID=3120506 RepID=UPI002FCE0067
MPSDRPAAPEPLAQLADVLARAGSGRRPSPQELAELLWLARHMAPGAESGRDDAPPPDPTTESPPESAADTSTPTPPHRPDDRLPRPERPPTAPEPPRAPLHLPLPPPAPRPGPDQDPDRDRDRDRGEGRNREEDPGPGPTDSEPHAALLAPAPPMLRHPLALQRSLRPLQRRTDAPAGQEVDEAATADRIARLGADPAWWLPVMRPVRERWLRLHLVHDVGPTMPVWRPLVGELHTALAQSGVFRTVTLHRAEPDGTVVGDAAYAPADGRTVTLLVSDCSGPQWRAGPAGDRWFAALRRWARRMPLAVVQPLPEHLWRDTALPPVPGLLSAPHRAAPGTALAFTPYDAADGPFPEGAVPVPVLEPGPEWLANWAALVASPGGTGYPGSAAALHRPLPADADDRTDVARLTAEDLVLRFRATASPEAFRLAGHLALGRPDLPVMRLVQAAVEPQPRPQHLAEVILSGMLTTVAGPPGSYAFRPGVRDLLLRGLPRTARTRTHELLLRTGGLIDERAGRSPGEFRAVTPDPDGGESGAGGEAFATISAESARRLTATGPAPAPDTDPAPAPDTDPTPVTGKGSVPTADTDPTPTTDTGSVPTADTNSTPATDTDPAPTTDTNSTPGTDTDPRPATDIGPAVRPGPDAEADPMHAPHAHPTPDTDAGPGPAGSPAPSAEVDRVPFPAGLGDRYRLVRRLTPTGRVWLAEDTVGGRTVTVRLHAAVTDRAARDAFLRDARRLRQLGHPNVVAVLDAGVADGTPYVVMEHLDGIGLNILTRRSGDRLPAPLIVSVGAQLAEALGAVHRAGATHGALEASRVVLLPDGTVKLSLFAPGRSARPGGRSEDLRALCELLLQLASGTSHLTVPIDSRQLTRLPRALRSPYAHALDQLMSRSYGSQAQGLDLLTGPEPLRRAREAYERRRYHALGPMRVELPDGAPGLPADLRALLAMLLLKHGRTVTHEELRWGLWDPGDEPRDPRAELRGMAARLATVLGPGALAVPSHGYALHTSADYVDVVRCEELVRSAEADEAAGAYADARAHITEALGLWPDGDPLADVPGPAARTARTRLLRLHLALYGRRAELDLTLGDHDRAATDLAALLQAHPFREDFRRLYLTALRHQGRVEEALEVYEEYELSGGRNPELLALGRELRADHGGPPDSPGDVADYEEPPGAGSLAAPDELPEGPFPTEDERWRPILAELEEDAEPEPVLVAGWGARPDPDEGDAADDDRGGRLDDDRGGGPDDRGDDRGDEEAFWEEFEEEDRDEDDPWDADAGYRTWGHYTFADAAEDDTAHSALVDLVTRLLADSGLGTDAYQLLHDPETGVLVQLAPMTELGGLLRATVEALPVHLALVGGLRLRVEFWQAWFGPDGEEEGRRAARTAVRAALAGSPAQAIIALSDLLHHEEVYEEGEAGPLFPPDVFRPLADGSGWYHLVHRPGAATTPEVRPDATAVRGPFPMPSGGWVPLAPDRLRTVVLRMPDGTLVPHDAARVRSAPGGTRSTWTYYEVDLTEHHFTSDIAGLGATWRVRDPVRAAARPGVDMGRILDDALAEARRTAGGDPAAALPSPTVPGYSVRWITGSGRFAPGSRRPYTAGEVLRRARCVLLGFDDVVARLFRPAAERDVLLDVMRFLVEERDPEDALSGKGPLQPGGGAVPADGPAGTLDLARALAGHRLAREAGARLDGHEELAARTARPVPLANRLIRTLHERGVPVAVVTDRAAGPVEKYLWRQGLTVTGGVHGRDADLARLLPDPDVLDRALDRLSAVPADCVLIGSSAAERSAAADLGLHFVGHAPGEPARRRLGEADRSTLLVPGLRPLLTAAEER